MTITARYASRCASCGQTITPGTKIEWTKGSPVRHTACSSPATFGATPYYRRRAQRDHEDCLSLGPCGPDCEYADLLGRR